MSAELRTHELTSCPRPGWYTVNPIKLETGLRSNSAGIPYALLLRIEAIGFPTFRLLLYKLFAGGGGGGRNLDPGPLLSGVRSQRL